MSYIIYIDEEVDTENEDEDLKEDQKPQLDYWILSSNKYIKR